MWAGAEVGPAQNWGRGRCGPAPTRRKVARPDRAHGEEPPGSPEQCLMAMPITMNRPLALAAPSVVKS